MNNIKKKVILRKNLYNKSKKLGIKNAKTPKKIKIYNIAKKSKTLSCNARLIKFLFFFIHLLIINYIMLYSSNSKIY
jgi:hypothetical protein